MGESRTPACNSESSALQPPWAHRAAMSRVSQGARDAGIHAWQFGNDVTSFQELADLLIARKQP